SWGQVVLTQSAAQSVLPGQSVSITCKASSAVAQYSGAQYYLAWYLQRAGEPPKLLHKSWGQVVLTQSAAQSVLPGQSVSITCKASSAVAQYSGAQYYLA
ncbi:hypothetical protein Z043_125867, partial [Scleropages formosus]